MFARLLLGGLLASSVVLAHHLSCYEGAHFDQRFIDLFYNSTKIRIPNAPFAKSQCFNPSAQFCARLTYGDNELRSCSDWGLTVTLTMQCDIQNITGCVNWATPLLGNVESELCCCRTDNCNKNAGKTIISLFCVFLATICMF